jgi:cyclopropane-fatty-acyl-phospholipid synthase
MDARKETIMEILRETYGPERAAQWFMRWRMFFMACAELFGYDAGQEWFVAHYLFSKRAGR